MSGEYGQADQAFLRRLVRAGIGIEHIYDVGASNGYWSWLASRAVPNATFDLFEPNDSPQYAERLKWTLSQRPDFRMHRTGLGDCDATFDLHIAPDGDVGSTLLEWKGASGKKPIPVRRLDGFIREQGLPQPDVIKMDTQGFELKILQGAEVTCRQTKALMLETWFYRAYTENIPLLSTIIDWLDHRDFWLFAMGDTWSNEKGQMYAVDAYFLRGDIAAQVAKAESTSEVVARGS